MIRSVMTSAALAALLLSAACSKPAQPAAPNQQAPRTNTQPTQPPASVPSPSSSAQAKPGKTPAKPAPELTDAQMAAAEAHFQRAKQLWNDAQTARNASNTEEFKRAIQASWKECEAMTDSLRTQIEWLEEADLDGWAMPASYVALQRRFDEWDRVRSMVRKNKPADR